VGQIKGKYDSSNVFVIEIENHLTDSFESVLFIESVQGAESDPELRG